MKLKTMNVRIVDVCDFDPETFDPTKEVVGEFETFSEAEKFAKDYGMKLGEVTYSSQFHLDGWVMTDDCMNYPYDINPDNVWGEDVHVFREQDEDEMKEYFYNEIEYNSSDMDDVETITSNYQCAVSALYDLEDDEAILIKGGEVWRRHVRVEDAAHIDDYDGHEWKIVAYKD